MYMQNQWCSCMSSKFSYRDGRWSWLTAWMYWCHWPVHLKMVKMIYFVTYFATIEIFFKFIFSIIILRKNIPHYSNNKGINSIRNVPSWRTGELQLKSQCLPELTCVCIRRSFHKSHVPGREGPRLGKIILKLIWKSKTYSFYKSNIHERWKVLWS